jgi:hypothetical protein
LAAAAAVLLGVDCRRLIGCQSRAAHGLYEAPARLPLLDPPSRFCERGRQISIIGASGQAFQDGNVVPIEGNTDLHGASGSPLRHCPTMVVQIRRTAIFGAVAEARRMWNTRQSASSASVLNSSGPQPRAPLDRRVPADVPLQGWRVRRSRRELTRRPRGARGRDGALRLKPSSVS